VKGTVLNDDKRIELRGKAPLRNSACKQIGTRDDQLIFDFVFRTKADDQRTVAAAPPFAIPPKAAILKDPRGAIDAVAKLNELKNSKISESIISSIPYDGQILGTCFYNGGFLNDEKEGDSRFIGYYFEIASYYSSVAAQLQVLGYPDRVWRQPLLGLRNKMLDVIIKERERPTIGRHGFGYSTLREQALPFENALEAVLADYRAKENPNILSVRGAGESCGGDFWGTFRVRLIPPDGKVWFISSLNYDWCKKSGYTPIEERCDFWVRILPDLSLPFGIYQYRVEWADGSKETDKIDIGDGRLDGTTIALRKQR